MRGLGTDVTGVGAGRLWKGSAEVQQEMVLGPRAKLVGVGDGYRKCAAESITCQCDAMALFEYCFAASTCKAARAITGLALLLPAPHPRPARCVFLQVRWRRRPV